MTVVFNIEGTTYTKVLPFFTDTDAALLTTQLQAFAQELRGEFDALKAAVLAANAGNVPAPTDTVNALVGQPIPVDVTPTSTPPAGDGTTTQPTPTDGGATTPTDGGATGEPTV